MTCCNRGFMLFLRIVMNKMTSQMVDNLFWAKKLREIIQHKQRVQDNKFPKGKEKSIVSAYTAAPQLTEINNTCERSFNFLFAEIEQIRLGKSHTVVQDLSRFDHEIFTTIQEALQSIGSLSFKDASTLVGRSLVSEFSEIDSDDSREGEKSQGQSAMGQMREQHSGRPMNSNVTIPYLPRLDRARSHYTLVLDLDETLVHFFEDKNTVRVRPYTVHFLKEMSKYYELVIFTAGTKEYADWALKFIPEKAASHFIDHRLYRDHTIQALEVFIKDLTNLGRDITKTIIIDNL